MVLRTSLDILSETVDRYERDGRSVRHVEAETDDAGRGTLHATVEVAADLPSPGSGESQPNLTLETAAVTDGGKVELEYSPTLLADVEPATEGAISASIRTVRVSDDGRLLLTVALTIDPEGCATSTGSETSDGERSDGDTPAAAEGESRGSEPPDQTIATSDRGEPGPESPSKGELEAVRDESLPPYEDVEYLQRVYDSCETFTEMSRVLEMEVAAETVRRYMIEAGVHVPTSYDTKSSERNDDGVATEPFVADGGGLPDDVRTPDVIDAVVDSVTLYEVGRRLDLDQQSTRALLERLDLSEFVPRRLPTGPEQELSHEEVARRIRQCIPAARDASAAHLNG